MTEESYGLLFVCSYNPTQEQGRLPEGWQRRTTIQSMSVLNPSYIGKFFMYCQNTIVNIFPNIS